MPSIQKNLLGVVLERDTKPTAEWREFLAGFGSSATDSITKGPLDALSGGVSSLIKLALSVQLEASTGEKVYYMTVMAFTWAVAQVSPTTNLSSDDLINLIRDSLKVSSNYAKDNKVFLPAEFIDTPTLIPIYQVIKDDFVDRLSAADSGISKETVSFAIDAAFSSGLYAVWASNPDNYRIIAEIANSPGRKGAERFIAWDAYRANLRYEFNAKPTFGQERGKLSLSQLYVPIRATWPINPTEDFLIDIDEPSPGTHNISILDNILSEWIDSKDNTDWLRLIGGGPGSGKSTTLKALAMRMADRKDWRPLFIPLQHIDLKKDLRRAIDDYFTERSDSPFSHPPLARQAIEDGPPMCLIFDGLDEIVAPGDAAREVVSDFSNKLGILISSINGGGSRKIKVIISGRLPSFQEAKKYLTPAAGAAVETYGYTPYRFLEPKDKSSLWSIDQRKIWWQQYASLIGSSAVVPEALTNQKLKSITHEPLLCYLLALSGYADAHWELAADNRNRIYGALMDSVYERGWGDGLKKRQGAGKTLSRQDFHKLMETIALAAWLGGDARVASEENFERAVSIMAAQSAWTTFTAENGEDVANLAMNFYLKSSEKRLRGFEFTHKSFGEYLAARALLEIAGDVAYEAKKRPDNALRDWHNATSTGIITPEILAFLTDGLRLRIASSTDSTVVEFIKNLKNMNTKLIEIVDQDGFPVNSGLSTWRLAEISQQNSECALWAITNSCAKALHRSGYTADAIINIDWEDKDTLSKIIRRLSMHKNTECFSHMLSYLDMEGQAVHDVIVEDASFEYSVMKEVVFARFFCSLGSFRGSNLTNARFYSASVRQSYFDGAKLDGMIIHNSNFHSCTFSQNTDAKIAVSGSSIVNMDSHQLDVIKGNILLLSHHSSSKDEIIDILDSRIKVIDSLEEMFSDSLVPDWTDMSSDNSDINDDETKV